MDKPLLREHTTRQGYDRAMDEYRARKALRDSWSFRTPQVSKGVATEGAVPTAHVTEHIASNSAFARVLQRTINGRSVCETGFEDNREHGPVKHWKEYIFPCGFVLRVDQ